MLWCGPPDFKGVLIPRRGEPCVQKNIAWETPDVPTMQMLRVQEENETKAKPNHKGTQDSNHKGQGGTADTDGWRDHHRISWDIKRKRLVGTHASAAFARAELRVGLGATGEEGEALGLPRDRDSEDIEYVQQQGGVWRRIGLYNGYDPSTSTRVKRVMHVCRLERQRRVLFSPPSGPNSAVW